jgi:prepilin-type N-terminal cleavage/methylation domain-containing protein
MNKKGFTLVELLAVIALLSIIIIIAVPAVTKLRGDSIERQANTQIEEIESAAEFYVRDEEDSLESIDVVVLINSGYIKPNVKNGEKGCENAKGCLYDPYGNNLTNETICIINSNNKLTAKFHCDISR